VLPPADPLAHAGGALRLSALADRSWVGLEPEHELSQLTRTACAAAGFEPRMAVRAAHEAVLPLLAAQGAGAALVPGSIVPAELRRLVHRTDPPLERALAAFARRPWSPLGEALVELLGAEPLPAMPAALRLVA
jgi:DNA-binding transcriptional LysR family regulator